jgi:hypothetical protein
MFNSTVLEVTIGLVFMFLILSLICSTMNEMIEALVRSRAAELEAAIKNLLNGQGVSPAPVPKPDTESTASAQGGSKGTATKGETKAESNGQKDSPGMASTVSLSDKLFKHPLITALRVKGKFPSYIPSRTFAQALFNLISPEGAPSGLQSLRNSILTLPSTSPLDPVRNALVSLIDDAQGDVNKFLGNIEDWYNQAMDRISGFYKRRAMWISFGVGLALAVILNANTFRVGQSLWASGALRSAVVSDVQSYLRTVPALPSTQTPQAPSPTAPAGGQSQGAPQEVAPAQSVPGNVQGQSGSAPGAAAPGFREQITKELQALQDIPLGWPWHPEHWWGWVFAVAGWLTTAIAISLGAPFWFDLLNKFMVFRSTIKPSESTKSAG